MWEGLPSPLPIFGAQLGTQNPPKLAPKSFINRRHKKTLILKYSFPVFLMFSFVFFAFMAFLAGRLANRPGGPAKPAGPAGQLGQPAGPASLTGKRLPRFGSSGSVQICVRSEELWGFQNFCFGVSSFIFIVQVFQADNLRNCVRAGLAVFY